MWCKSCDFVFKFVVFGFILIEVYKEIIKLKENCKDVDKSIGFFLVLFKFLFFFKKNKFCNVV